MTNEKAIEVIRSNWPDLKYSMLIEALELAIQRLSQPEPAVVVDRRFVEAVEIEVSMGHPAWDTISPLDICRAVLTVAKRLSVPAPDSAEALGNLRDKAYPQGYPESAPVAPDDELIYSISGGNDSSPAPVDGYDPKCYHECPDCNTRCNCADSPCSHCDVPAPAVPVEPCNHANAHPIARVNGVDMYLCKCGYTGPAPAPVAPGEPCKEQEFGGDMCDTCGFEGGHYPNCPKRNGTGKAGERG